MDGSAVKEIAQMQLIIDSYGYFVANLLAKLQNPEGIVLAMDEEPYCSAVWKEVEKLQNKLKEYECKASN